MKYCLTFIVLLFAISCGNKRVVKEHDELADHIISNELIIQLKENVAPTLLEEKFSDKDFTLIKEISAHMRAYLYSFNEDLIEPQEMIGLVKAMEEVSSVGFNKKLEERK